MFQNIHVTKAHKIVDKDVWQTVVSLNAMLSFMVSIQWLKFYI